MNKFEALKLLPVDRFADLFFDMCQAVNTSGEFRDTLLEPFPDELLPALQKCSTGEDIPTACLIRASNNNSHHLEDS